MDRRRATSPPSFLVHEQNGNHGRRQSTTVSAGMPFSSRLPVPMAIPNSRHDRIPPPLPPPRFIDDLAAGSDPGWAWANNPSGGFDKARGNPTAELNFPKSWNRETGDKRQAQPPERPQYMRRDSSTSTVRSPTEVDRRHRDFVRHQDEGYYSLSGPRTSAMSQQLVSTLFFSVLRCAVPNQVRTSHALPQSVFQLLMISLVLLPWARRCLLGNAQLTVMRIRLHGERHLQQRNTESSSQTYDNKLLSKLGKPKTPSRPSIVGSLENSATSSLPYHLSGRHPDQLRSLSFPKNSCNSGYSNSAQSDHPLIKQEPSEYGSSPLSRPMSPGLITSAASERNFNDLRSPTFEGSTPSSTTGSDQYPQYPQRFPSSTNVLRQQKSRRSTSGSLLSSYDESARSSLKNTANITSPWISPLKRENYDQGMFSETDSADSTFRMEDSVRQLHLEDRVPLTSGNPNLHSIPYHNNPSNPFLHTSRSRPGMKRKPSQSPPPDLSGVHAANAQLLAAAGMNIDLYRNNSQHPAQRLSPVHHFGQNQGSISSQSSAGPRNNSHASSAGLSVGSSITSLDQHSPGTMSPSSEQQAQHYQQQNGQEFPYVNSLAMDQGPSNTHSQPQQQYPQAPLDTPIDPSVDTKPQIHQGQRRNTGPNMQSNAYICACCPKKPKKFETTQELRLVVVTLLQRSCKMLTISSRLETMKLRSSTRVHSAPIDSKTRTKQSVTRIPFTFASNFGHARLSMAVTIMLSIHLPLFRLRTIVLPNNHLPLLQIRLPLLTHAATVAINFRMTHNPIGTRVLHISPINTNSANAISQRSSSVLITSANISSIVTPAPVGSGQTCWRQLA